MPLRTFAAAAALAGVAAAASCRKGAPSCAAEFGDSPSLLQAAPQHPGKQPHGMAIHPRGSGMLPHGPGMPPHGPGGMHPHGPGGMHPLGPGGMHPHGPHGMLPHGPEGHPQMPKVPRPPHMPALKDVVQDLLASGAGDDEDKDAELVGVASMWVVNPDYHPPEENEVFGDVWITASKGRSDSTKSQRLFWNLLDVDSRCHKGPSDGYRSCVIRIEKDNRCLGVKGKAFYDEHARNFNPWILVTYTSVKGEETSRTRFSYRAETGVSAKDIKTGSVVVYDYYGEAMACAPIDHVKLRPAATQQPMALAPPEKGAARVDQALVQDTELVQEKGKGPCKSLRAWHFERVPGCGPGINVWGRVLIFEIMGDSTAIIGQYITWNFEDVDPRCDKGPSTEPKSCAILVTKGESCKHIDEEEQWDPHNVHRNTWAHIGYTAVKTTNVWAAFGYGVPVLTGSDSPDIIGNSVLVYDYYGHVAACAILEIGH